METMKMKYGFAVASAFACLALAACTNNGAVEKSPNAQPQQTTGESTIETASTTEYTDDSAVIKDAEGKRSFPTISRQADLDARWAEVVRQFKADGLPEPQRPNDSLIKELTGGPEDAQVYISCMHDAGWTSVKKVEGESGGIDSGEISPDQFPAYLLADYQCNAQYHLPQFRPMDETEMEELWDYQVKTVIPCLEKEGVVVDGFPSKEAFVDRYFAERQYVLASDWGGEEIQRKGREDASYSCFSFPPDSRLAEVIKRAS